MSSAFNPVPISVAEYLAGEQDAKHRHEYVHGVIYAMVGATNVHNLISTNTIVLFGASLRGQKCRAFNSDTKIRVRSIAGTRFYYPDALIVCEPNADHETFQDHPVVIVDVMSPSTRRLDESEKRDAYLTIDSLCVYIRLEIQTPVAVLDRRTDEGFQRERYEGLDAVIAVPELGFHISLKEIYEDVVFSPHPTQEHDSP